MVTPENQPPSSSAVSSSTGRPRNILIDVLVVIVLGIFGVIGYKLAPLLTPLTDVSLPVSTCDLGATPCRIALPEGGQVEFAIDPRPVPALKPLRLLAIASGTDVRKIEVDFAGVDMKMGYNRPALENLGDGRFSGQANLPVCITGKMQWQATVIIEAGSSVVAAPFIFDAESQ